VHAGQAGRGILGRSAIAAGERRENEQRGRIADARRRRRRKRGGVRWFAEQHDTMERIR
jgi:hypothetical protein